MALVGFEHTRSSPHSQEIATLTDTLSTRGRCCAAPRVRGSVSYSKLAASIKVKSDFLNIHRNDAEVNRGLYVDLPKSLELAKVTVRLAKQLQLPQIAKRQMHCLGMAALSWGDYRVAWSATQEYFAASLEEMSATHIARATLLRITLLMHLGNSAKAVACVDFLLANRHVGWFFKKSGAIRAPYALALFRAGREEDSREVIKSALRFIRRHHKAPWDFVQVQTSKFRVELEPALIGRELELTDRLLALARRFAAPLARVAVLELLHESYLRSSRLRKIAKIARLARLFGEILSFFKIFSQNCVSCEDYTVSGSEKPSLTTKTK